MPLLSYLQIAALIAVTGIIVGTLIGRLSGRWLVSGLSFALATMVLSPLLRNLAVTDTVKSAPTFPDRNRQAVIDAANVIPDLQEQALAQKIEAYVERTGHQLAVVTVSSLQGYDIRDYGYRLGRAWGLGRKGIDDGAILLLAPTERKIDIEVGYGLEPTLTDALTNTIIRERIAPKLKAGDVAGALSNGADSIMAAASGQENDNLRSGLPRASKHKTYSVLEIVSYVLILAVPAALLTWLVRRSEGRTGPCHGQVKASGPSHPDQKGRGNVVETARSPKDDNLTAGLGAAAVVESFTRYSEADSLSDTTPSVPSIDAGSFDSGGGSFGGGGASVDY